jgi:hypothetical protein
MKHVFYILGWGVTLVAMIPALHGPSYYLESMVRFHDIKPE